MMIDPRDREVVPAALGDLVTAPFVQVDDLLEAHPEGLPERPEVGFAPSITDAGLVTLTVV